MKIVTATKIQNESDIIESFCRYYASFCDAILLMDESSSDNTIEIIQKLVEEGLPVVQVAQPTVPLFGGYKHRHMVQLAFEKYGADWVILPDADEFLFLPDGRNPRESFKELNPDIEYQVERCFYVYSKDPDDNGLFLPNVLTEYRSEDYKILKKVLVGRKQYALGGQMVVGNHALEYPADLREIPKVEVPGALCFGHFPVRSAAQVTAKVINMELLHLCRPGRGSYAWNISKLYDQIKESRGVSLETARRMSLEYSLRPEQAVGDIPVVVGVMPTDFCVDKLALRYTDYSASRANAFCIVLTQTEKLLESVADWLEKAELFDALGEDTGAYPDKFAQQQAEINILKEHLRYYKSQCDTLPLLEEHLAFYREKYTSLPLLEEHLEYYKKQAEQVPLLQEELAYYKACHMNDNNDEDV